MAILPARRKLPLRILAFTKVKNVLPSERAIILPPRTEYSSSIRVVLYARDINLLDATRKYVIANM